MKKIVFTLLIILPLLSFAQVGINTTTPKAALDVESTNNGILIPRVQLTSNLDNTTVVNPTLAPLETSTLIYNIAPAGVAPNDVVAGFYYWNGTSWIAIAGTATTDHDWHEVGTTTPPDAITDNMFHTGNVAIGKNTADYPLEVNTTNFQFGINNTFNNPTVTSVQKATINNYITDNTNDRKYGIINTILNNSATSGGIGTSNSVNGDGNVFYGNSNSLAAGMASNGADIIGTRNYFSNNSTNTVTKGMYNIFEGSGANFNFIYGTQNDFRVTATQKNGAYNIFNANTDGDNIGLYNQLNSDMPLNNQTGIQNSFITGAATLGNNIGISNTFIGDGNGNKTGILTTINSNGNGEHAGAVQTINGSAAGTGTKYGTRTEINPTAGGTHFGIHSTVLKPGATNFAGYFLGNVGIGTTTTNTYTFPPSRGINGQIMQTDGSGALTWQNPSTFAWSLNGNAGTTPTASFTNPITATENFIGTTDGQNLMLGTNNRGRFLIYANGGILTGKPNTSVVGGPNPNASLNVYTISTGPGSEIFTGSFFTSIGINNGTNIAASFSAYQATNNYALVVPTNGGLVGIGTTTPTTTLHVENPTAGALRIVDGTQAAGRVLTSNATGIATWQSVGTLGPAWSVNGNSAINTPTAPAIYGTSTIGATQNFMGTTNANAVVFGTNNIERMRIVSTGNVGIGIATAPAKLTVFGGFLSPTFPNATTNAMLRIGNNTEGLDIGKAGFADNFTSWLQSGYNGNPDPLSLQPLGGNVGVGITNPSNRLHVNSATAGAVRIVDGTQAVNSVLTSDVNGVGTWRPSAITGTVGTLVAPSTGNSIPFNTTNFIQTGSSITLPPGRYVVNVTMLMSVFPASTPNNSSFWLRTAFSDSNLPNPSRTLDTVGSYYVSGNLPGSSFFSILSGSLIINNATAANKTYYYIAGEALTTGTTQSLLNYSGWGEDSIVAYRLN